ncbi:hypothetical protein OPAG_06173 [Rhodococcus opacus PD630]|nr:hypothetical protein OPAG_06173 [Rhodococcus opacus PD630]
MRRRPRSPVHGQGLRLVTTTESEVPDSPADTEPDYRFTLANERTFLAWIRTSLGLLAGGVAVHELVESSRIEFAHLALGTACVALAFVLAVGAYQHWRTVQSAMRRTHPLPRPVLVPVLCVGVGVIAVLAVATMLFS